MRIYRNAKIIIGRHGASFSNTLWCKPKPTLIELFANNYYPPYFRYVAEILDLRYFAIVEKEVKKTHYSNLDKDIYINPRVLKTSLEEIITKKGKVEVHD